MSTVNLGPLALSTRPMNAEIWRSQVLERMQTQLTVLI